MENEHFKKVPNYRSARVIEVVEMITCEGEGVKDDPAREVVTYWDKNGKLLAVRDERSEN